MQLAVRFSDSDIRDKSYGWKVGSYVGKIIEFLAAPAGGADGLVDSIVVADDSYYGKAIAEACPEEGFTDDGYFLGVGKTVRLAQAKRPIARIILRIWLVEYLMNNGYAPGSSPSDKVIHALFAIAHELGHAVDIERRKLENPLERVFDRNWLRQWRVQIPETMMDEIAAQWFASSISTKSYFEERRLEFKTDVEKIVSDVATARAGFQAKTIGINDLANAGSLGGWRILDMFAKCRILQIALAEADRGPAIDCPALGPCDREIFGPFEVLLEEILSVYPGRVGDMNQRMEDCWGNLMCAFGLLFQEKDEGFGLRVC